MFPLPAAKLKEEVATICTCARLNAEFRRLRYSPTDASLLPKVCPYEQVVVPGRAEWGVYDHCSGITRLYAVYERFIADLATAWLKLVPSLFSSYSSLPEPLRKQHIRGVARVLPKLDERRYRHLTGQQVMEGLYRGQKNNGEYELLYELFAITERNLRLDALTELFARVAIPGIQVWLAHHGELQAFMATVYGGQETVDSKLNALVSYRNDAAHGEDIDQVLGLNEFINLAAFVEKLCAAVAECAFHRVCRCQAANACARVLGKVTEVFAVPGATVTVMDVGSMTVGQELIMINDTSCRPMTIQSLQLNGTTIQSIAVTMPTEVGVKFDFLPPKGSELLVVQPKSDFFVGADI